MFEKYRKITVQSVYMLKKMKKISDYVKLQYTVLKSTKGIKQKSR